MAITASGHRMESNCPIHLTALDRMVEVLVADGNVHNVPCRIFGMAAIMCACFFSSVSAVVRLAVLVAFMPSMMRWSCFARRGALRVVIVVPTSVSSSVTLIACPPKDVCRSVSLALGHVESAANLAWLFLRPEIHISRVSRTQR